LYQLCLNAQQQLTKAIRKGLKGYCDKHAHAPRLLPTGDVTEDLRVKLELAKWRVAMKKGHKRRGNYALSPSEFGGNVIRGQDGGYHGDSGRKELALMPTF
jgi:hypothetical protein